MLQWKQQVNAINWEKTKLLLVNYSNIMRVFVLVLVYNHTWQLLFVTVRCKQITEIEITCSNIIKVYMTEIFLFAW